MTSILRRLFIDHPREVDETYGEHMGASWGFGFRLLRLAGAAFLHGVIPGLCRTTVSDNIKSMAHDMGCRAQQAKEGQMREAGAWDSGL